MITDYISKIASGADLTFDEARDVMECITGGIASDAQIAAVLMGLRMKGETVEEIAGLASVMREKATRIKPRVSGRLTDTCGTGGAPLRTINISTISGFVAAGAGVIVAKHGNRSVTSMCGSADVLEALGASITISPSQVQTVIERVGFGFLFAPSFHPSMKYALGPRKQIQLRTVFNVLGPLTNPADAKGHVLGVFAKDLVPKIAGALTRLGVERAVVAYGEGGLDELSTMGTTFVAEVDRGSKIRTYEASPQDFGFKACRPDDLAGMTPPESAKKLVSILSGEGGAGRDVVLLNSAAAISASGIVGSIKEGIPLAAESIDGGKALEKMRCFVDATNSV